MLHWLKSNLDRACRPQPQRRAARGLDYLAFPICNQNMLALSENYETPKVVSACYLDDILLFPLLLFLSVGFALAYTGLAPCLTTGLSLWGRRGAPAPRRLRPRNQLTAGSVGRDTNE